MPLFKRNIWSLFWLILLGGLILLAVILYYRWSSIFNDYATYHTNRAELVSQSVDSVLRTQELVLDVIGRELLSNEQVFDNSLQLPLLDNLLSMDKALVGFGLARTDGTLVRVSSSLDLSKLHNLRTHPSTRDSFKQALESEAMVLGKSYHVEALDAWVIPIRKALRDKTGKVVAVMTAGLRMDSSDSVFNKRLHDGPYDSIILLREVDGYAQFISRANTGSEAYTHAWTPMVQRIENHLKIETELDMPMAEIMGLQEAVTISSKRGNQRSLAASIFNNRYQVWLVSETSWAPIWRKFIHSLLNYLLIFIAVGGIFFALFKLIDRAEQKRRSELLYHSTHDDLTGLLNRAGLLSRLQDLISKQQTFSLIVINIDNFNGVNDRFGQETGDAILIKFGHRVQAMLNGRDSLARLGNDEFVITTAKTDPVALENSCHTLVEQLAQVFEAGQLRLSLTASIGVSSFPEHGNSSSELIRSAHLALVRAKKNRNAVSIYRTEMEMDYLRRLTVEQRLRQALAHGGLHMMYQPQLDERGKIVGMEALARWNDEELGVVSPAEFVEVAERSGLMLALGHFVLDTSLREYSSLRTELGHGVDLSVNISVIQFEHPDFVEGMLNLLKTYQVPPQELVLEITETLIMTNFDQVLQTIHRLRHEGIRLSLDDFGTGYSSLGLLRKLPIDELKIDKSFVDSLLDDDRAANMIQSIIHIARSHNMYVVVEGVESEVQANALFQMGCRRFQGYYFSRPEHLARVQEMLESNAFPSISN